MLQRKNKDGQVTLFIIFGVLVVITLVIAFYLYLSQNGSITDDGDLDVRPLKVYMEQCVETTLKQSLGYAANQRPATIDSFEQVVEDYFNDNFKCDGTDTNFPQFTILEEGTKSYRIEALGTNVNNIHQITATVRYPLRVTQNEQTTVVEIFEVVQNL